MYIEQSVSGFPPPILAINYEYDEYNENHDEHNDNAIAKCEHIECRNGQWIGIELSELLLGIQ